MTSNETFFSINRATFFGDTTSPSRAIILFCQCLFSFLYEYSVNGNILVASGNKVIPSKRNCHLGKGLSARKAKNGCLSEVVGVPFRFKQTAFANNL